VQKECNNEKFLIGHYAIDEITRQDMR